MAAEVQAKLQALSEDFNKLQQELQTIVSSRQKLEAQKQENVGVEKEFAKLKSDETIYKLVGPVLLKQDRVEAESTVKGRLEFISKEIDRLETQINETQDKIEKKKGEIIQVQTSIQASPGAGPGKAAVQA